MDDKAYTLIEHLQELRVRLVRGLIAVAIATAFTFYFVDDIFHFLIGPIIPYLPEPKKLIVLSPLEQIVAYLRIAVISGVFVAAPALLYQVWSFIAPGLYDREKKFVVPFIVFGTLSFIGGAAFGFYVLLPTTFKFLVQVLPADVMPQYTVERYFALVTQLLLAMGVVFELPLVLAILSLAGVVTTAQLKSFRKYNIIGSFVLSAFLTPTVDPYSQTIMALPLIVFYELGILFSYVTERRRQA